VGVRTANSGRQGLAMASVGAFDLLLIDLCLPDMLGTELVRRLNQISSVPFVLISGFLRTETTVEAMKLGASNVLEKPITLETLRAVVFSLLGDRLVAPAVGHSRPTTADSREESPIPMRVRPRSAAERWATHVIKACESDRDLTTVGEWAAYVGVSRTSLGESCELLGIHPRAARDLMRLLRALRQASTDGYEPETLLLVSDRRTLRTLMVQGGLTTGVRGGTRSVDQFLTDQRFVPRNNEGLKALRSLLGLEP
jgi:DNA-binding response OmpR family regulator